MKLYVIPGACSLAPHIALRELNLPFDLVTVDRETKRTSDGEDYLTINPLGYVGSLKLDDGNVLSETSTILEYLLDLKPQDNLGPLAGTWERVRFREWLSFLSCEINCTMSPLLAAERTETTRMVTMTQSRMFMPYASVLPVSSE